MQVELLKQMVLCRRRVRKSETLSVGYGTQDVPIVTKVLTSEILLILFKDVYAGEGAKALNRLLLNVKIR